MTETETCCFSTRVLNLSLLTLLAPAQCYELRHFTNFQFGDSVGQVGVEWNRRTGRTHIFWSLEVLRMICNYWWPRGGVAFGGNYCNCFIFVSDLGIPNDSTNTYLLLWNRGILEFQTTQITWSLVTNGWTSIERAAPFTPNRSCLTIGSTAESGKIRPRPNGSCFWVRPSPMILW